MEGTLESKKFHIIASILKGDIITGTSSRIQEVKAQIMGCNLEDISLREDQIAK
jgi:hypothetical protein